MEGRSVVLEHAKTTFTPHVLYIDVTKPLNKSYTYRWKQSCGPIQPVYENV